MGSLLGSVYKPPPLVTFGIVIAACCGGPVRCGSVIVDPSVAALDCSASSVAASTAATGGSTSTTKRPKNDTVPPKSLIGAASTGDVFRMVELLDKGEDINQANADGRTALFCAAYEDETEAAQLLIARGADVNKANAPGDTPLLWASAKGNLAVVTSLLDKGADPNRTTQQGHTALLRAVIGIHADVAALLLDRGADPNISGLVDHGTACAVSEEFHARGTRPVPPGFPTTTARAEDVESYFRTLGTAPSPIGTTKLTGCPPAATAPFDKVSPLPAATYLFQPELVAKLLDKGADPNALAFGAYSPLYVAAVLGDDLSVVGLLAKGGDPTVSVPGVASPWHAACGAGHLTTARLIGSAVMNSRGQAGELAVACPPPAGEIAGSGASPVTSR